MLPEEAIRSVQKIFPFHGYMDENHEMYLTIARTVLRYIQPGARILDFGSGPGDITAVIQLLGMNCTAYDDLQDHWHNIGSHRERIMSFMSELGIDFHLAIDDQLPFPKESFDMLMMHNVIEHLHDSPRDLINDLVELVRPGGFVFITVPNSVNIRKRIFVLCGRTNYQNFEYYYWYPGHWRGHVREYSRNDLIKLTKYLGLDCLELRGVHFMVERRRLPAIVKPIYYALSAGFKGWRDSWLLVVKKRAEWTPNKSLPDHELHRILGMFTTVYGTDIKYNETA